MRNPESILSNKSARDSFITTKRQFNELLLTNFDEALVK